VQEALTKLSQKDIDNLLKVYRINLKFETKNEEQIKQEKIKVLLLISHPDFWRLHLSIHPNFRRVKNWLWVHSRYRKKVTALVEKAENLKKDLRLWESVKLGFMKFNHKLEGHTVFEEEQLFLFIRENIKPETHRLLYPVHFDALNHQHDTLLPDITQKIVDCLEGQAQMQWEKVAQYLKEYKNALFQHLLMEERCLVMPWLNWNDDMYGTYRTYLTWKSARMY